MPQKSTLRSGPITSRSVFTRAASSSAGVGLRCPDEIAARLFIGLELDEAALFRVLEEVRECLEAIVGLVEAGLPALERLLDHRAPDFLALAPLGDERVQGLDEKVEGLLLLVA